jgi:hypothetical protein
MLGLLFAAWWSGGCCWVLDGGVGHRSGETKKKREMRRERKCLNKIIKILFKKKEIK